MLLKARLFLRQVHCPLQWNACQLCSSNRRPAPRGAMFGGRARVSCPRARIQTWHFYICSPCLMYIEALLQLLQLILKELLQVSMIADRDLQPDPPTLVSEATVVWKCSCCIAIHIQLDCNRPALASSVSLDFYQADIPRMLSGTVCKTLYTP